MSDQQTLRETVQSALGATDTPNIKAAKGFFEAQYSGDFETAFRDYAHPDFRFVVSSADNEALRAAIPWAGYAHRGRQGYERLTTLLFSEYEPLEFKTTRFSDTGDQVFVEGHFVFRHRQTAKIADSDFIARFEMRDGKIAGGQFYENTAAVAEARKAG